MNLRTKAQQEGGLNGFYFTPIHLIYRTTQQRRHGSPEILTPEDYCL
jgi:hypothetical protein